MDGFRTSVEGVTANGSSRPKYLHSPSIVPGVVLISDLLSIILSGILSYLYWVEFNSYALEYYIFAVSFVVFVSIILLDRGELYNPSAIMGPIWRSDGILVAVATSFLLFLSIAFSFNAIEIYADSWLIGFAVTSFLTIWVARDILREVFALLSRRHVLGRSLVVLGSGRQATLFLKRLHLVQPHFTHVAGVYDWDKANQLAEIEGHRIVGDLDDFEEAARREKIDDIVIAMPWNAETEITKVVERLKELPVSVFVSMDLVGYQLSYCPSIGSNQELPMFELVQRPISGWGSILKRIEDLGLAILALILLSPLLGLVALLIKLDSPGPILFRQARLGFNNQQFDIFKFRSMYHREIPENRVKQVSKGDPRITKIGRFIRRTSIDELPQLFNVINGSMSLVGPRPHALSHNEEFAQKVRGYIARHRVKPGITGWAQVNGWRGETDTLEKIQNRTEHDTYYTDNWSLAFDIRILVLTVVSVLFHKSAY